MSDSDEKAPGAPGRLSRLIRGIRSRNRAAFALVILGEVLLASAFGTAAFALLRPSASVGQEVAGVVLADPAAGADAMPATMPAGTAGVFIRIPRIGVDEAIRQGVSDQALDVAVGHFPRTALPGGAGNCALAGHAASSARHGAPFRRLEELKAGDDVQLHDIAGRTVSYRVTSNRIVNEHDLTVLDPTPDARLTLVTCIVPSRITHQRRIIVATRIDQD